MASASTINAWIEELSNSLLPSSPVKIKQRPRKAAESFRKQIRHHNFARTNQFDVSDRLDGLEEKFQVLNREDLSDALYDRRIELRKHEEQWVPDVLDLILRLSLDPLRRNNLIDASEATALTDEIAVLRWSDVEVGNPFDKNDPIWKVPNFSDLSSEDDEIEASTATTSPASVKQRKATQIESDGPQFAQIFRNLDIDRARLDLDLLKNPGGHKEKLITEIQLIRQTLFMIQGYPTDIFEIREGQIQLYRYLELQSISKDTIHASLADVQRLCSDLHAVKRWTAEIHSTHWLQTVTDQMERAVQLYTSAICAIEETLIHPRTSQVASFLAVVEQLLDIGKPLQALAVVVQRFENADSIACLDVLYNAIYECYFAGDTIAVDTLLTVFVKAFATYLRPINTWVEEGVLSSTSDTFFVLATGIQNPTSNLWNGAFELVIEGQNRPPIFLQNIAQPMFACGKTVAFINRINGGKGIDTATQHNPEPLLKKLESLFADPAVPFPMALSEALDAHFSSLLVSKTLVLRQLLETQCGMTRTLDAFEYLYLRMEGVRLDAVENRIFTRIDKCMDNWNDRFLVADMLEDIYADVNCIDLDSITVRSIHTSSRSMESRRRSVRILEALAIDYSVPWPVANIISQTSLTAYRRISLHLTQIRRAKYMLEHSAYVHVNSTPISNNPKDQTLAQATTFMLLQFTNTLYDHFTAGVALPMTLKMRMNLRDAATVDAMIAVHEAYVSTLEFTCLTSKPLKVLRETLVGLLDMCIRFADLVSTPQDVASGDRRDSADVEAGSFVSAQSRKRRGRSGAVRLGNGKESDSDDDEDTDQGEGYSSFVVLDQDTSVALEIRRLQTQFRRQLDFFVAGLRGVGRSGGAVQEFETLAERLEWKGKSDMRV